MCIFWTPNYRVWDWKGLGELNYNCLCEIVKCRRVTSWTMSPCLRSENVIAPKQPSKKMSKVVWETLKCSQILDEIKEEENLELELEFFLTLPQSPSEAESRNAKYDWRCNEECNRHWSTWFLITHERIVTNLLNLMRGWWTLLPKSMTMELKKMEMQCGEIQNVAISTTPRGNSKDAQTSASSHQPKGKC